MKINKSSFVSPNFDARKDNVDMIIIHSTHMTTNASLKRLCDKTSPVSCHYLIDLEGNIYQLVSDDSIAWHAGVSYWAGRTNLNRYSIGIELVDRFDNGETIEKFPKAQISNLIELLKIIIAKFNIRNNMILAHSDIAPDRKDDPGENFPWKDLARHKIGIYSDTRNSGTKKFFIQSEDKGEEVAIVQKMLSDYGYKICIDGYFGKEMCDVVKAFKRHFDQRKIDNTFDEISFNILSEILSLR